MAQFDRDHLVTVYSDALTFIAPRIEDTVAHLGGTTKPRYVGRPEYASTAAGLMSQHNAELKAFLNEALTL